MKKYLYQRFLPNCDTSDIDLENLTYDGKNEARMVSISELDDKIDTEENLIDYLRQFARDDVIVLKYDRPDFENPILREYALKTLKSYLYWIRYHGYECYWEQLNAA